MGSEKQKCHCINVVAPVAPSVVFWICEGAGSQKKSVWIEAVSSSKKVMEVCGNHFDVNFLLDV